jgi:hypothetical protein
MKSLVESLVATAGACMLVCGCGRMPSPASPDLGGPNGLITWSSSASKRDPLPGIEQGSVYHLGTVFVVWSDAPGGGGGSSNSNVQGVTCQGSLLGKDGRRVEFNCETKDGKRGPVTVNGVTYDLANGNLFLFSSGGDRAQVKQLKRSLSEVKFERESLEAFGRNDPDIVGFFTTPVKPK